MAWIIRTRPGGMRIGVLTFLGAVACSSGDSTGSTGSNSSSVLGREGSDGGDITTEAGDEDIISCANDPRAEPYVPNMSQPGNAGVLTFTLVSASPAPPALGDGNLWTLKVVDANGQSVPDVTFSLIQTWMPDHGHGSTPGVAMSNGDGTYAISNLYFFMPGLWQITFNAQLPSGADAAPVTDSATFSFCVGG